MRGIRLQDDQFVVSLIVVDEGEVLTATENGYGKRTPTDEFPVYNRGGQGVIAINTSERNGELVGAVLVREADEVILISNRGTLVRTEVSQISSLSRNTQGVTLIRLGKDERLVQVEPVAAMEDDGEDEELEDQNAEE